MAQGLGLGTLCIISKLFNLYSRDLSAQPDCLQTAPAGCPPLFFNCALQGARGAVLQLKKRERRVELSVYYKREMRRSRAHFKAFLWYNSKGFILWCALKMSPVKGDFLYTINAAWRGLARVFKSS
jgi:hypothetical protein